MIGRRWVLGGLISGFAAGFASAQTPPGNTPKGIAPDDTRPSPFVDPIPPKDRRVFFAHQSAALSDTAQESALRVAELMHRWSRETLDICGYAGPAEAAMWSDRDGLCLARANAVFDFLVAAGVADRRLTVGSGAREYISATTRSWQVPVVVLTMSRPSQGLRH